MRTVPILAAAAFAIAGCSTVPPASELPSGLALGIAPQTAEPGSTTQLTLTNQSGQPIGYNLCLGGFERKRAGVWVPELTATKPCGPEIAVLEPGGSASGPTALHPALPPGEYRYATEVSATPGIWMPKILRSNSFTVPRRD